jgi:hypothetical protein
MKSSPSTVRPPRRKPNATLMRIRLELARSHDFPDGSTRHGYTFILPLAKDGRLDRDAFARNPEICTVHRFWEGEGDEVGQLERSRGDSWAFSFRTGSEDDEAIHRLGDHVFREGEYLSVREHDGRILTFRIVDVRPAPGLAAAARGKR